MTLAEMCERLKCDRPHKSITMCMIRNYCKSGVIKAEKQNSQLYMVSENSYIDFLLRIDTHRLPQHGGNRRKKLMQSKNV